MKGFWFKLKNRSDFIGSVFGIVGAVLVALNIGINALGYLLFLVSSIAWVIFAIKTKNKHLFYMNVVFSAINTIGLLRYGLS